MSQVTNKLRFYYIASACFLILIAQPASAVERILTNIDLSEQRLSLFVDGRHEDNWPVSTTRLGYRTPVGTFHAIRFERDWHSRKYDWAPMPYSISFLAGFAIHGTTEIKRLGQAVSQGCVRLRPSNTARLFELARQVGKTNTRIVIRL